MTQGEYLQLDQSATYNFNLYWGDKKYGYIAEEENKYFIVSPSQENKEKLPSDVGFKVNLEFIESWEKVTNREQISSNGTTNNISYGQEHADILVIFGAGASLDYSFDSNLTTDNRPPLANNLFSDNYNGIIQNFPGAISLSSEILKSKSIEQYFQNQWDKIIRTHNRLLLSKLIDTQYYLRHLFQTISTKCNETRKNNYNILIQQLYNSLIEKSSSERAMLVTFNYDTLLEKSITQTLKYGFNTIHDYVNFEKSKFLVFKPHGSWNWGRKINETFFNENSIDLLRINGSLSNIVYNIGYSQNKLNQYISREIEVLDTNFRKWQNEYFPNLLIPYSKKDDFIMPDNHNLVLETFLPNVKKIIAIGWKGTELAFQKLLQKHLYKKNIDFIYVNLKDKNFEKEMKVFLPNAVFKEFAPFQGSKGTFSEFTEYILDNENLIY